LADAVRAHGPLCVGIDPHPALLTSWGLSDDAVGLERFASTVLAALAGRVAVLKPQSAFFERHGSAGIAVLERTLRDAAGSGTLTLLDVKRGDIGSTMVGYAQAYLAAGAHLAADAVTLSPYLGFGSLAPALELAADTGRGVFVLARTSNPEGASVQEAIWQGRGVGQAVVDAVSSVNAGLTPLGDVGVVVGATHEHGLCLSELNGPILAPGLGEQGARPADLADRFADIDGLVLPSVSRSLLRHGPKPAAVRAAARQLNDQLALCRINGR